MTTLADAAAFLTQEYGLSGMKLQKILYYAQALALTQEGEALFPEDFEAWQLGPVNRALWKAGGALGEPVPVHTEAQGLLRAAWDKYGHLDVYELSDLTHADAPWQMARAGLPLEANSDHVIYKKIMENFYLCRELVQREDGQWEHRAPHEADWKQAKLRLLLKRKARGRLTGEARGQFLREQVVATQRLEGITVNL